MNTRADLADDMLRGADEIARFLFGEQASRRKVYYLAECTRIPIFRIGAVLCARRSVLLHWIAQQEARTRACGGALDAARAGEAGNAAPE
jgi:hypothetical protein